MDKVLLEYSRKWKLDHCKKMMTTSTGTLYKVNSPQGKAIIKILTELGRRDDVGSWSFLKNTLGHKTVRLFESDEKAQLMEFLPGPNLYEFSKRGKEERASEIFIDIIKEIQSTKINLAALLKKGKELADYLISTQEKEVLLHGDLHHENVMKRANGDYICFDPKGMVGDPAYELGTTLKNPWAYPNISQNLEMYRKRVDQFSSELGLVKERIMGFSYVHLCLSILWALEDKKDYSHQESLLKMIRPDISNIKWSD